MPKPPEKMPGANKVYWTRWLYLSSLTAGFALSFFMEILRMEEGAHTVRMPSFLGNGVAILWLAMIVLAVVASRKAGLVMGAKESWISKGAFFLSLFGFLFAGLPRNIIYRSLAAECAAANGMACYGQSQYSYEPDQKHAFLLKACSLKYSVGCLALCRFSKNAEERSLAETIVKCD